MRQVTRDGITFLQFDLLADLPFVRHGVFLKEGGISQGPYATLNACYSVGDDRAAVKANRDRMAAVLGIPQLIQSDYEHGDTVMIAKRGEIPLADGLATAERHLGIIATHADCQAGLFVDVKQHVIANVHCGWRSNVKNIYKNTVEFLQTQFGSRPEDLLVCIAPSLGPEASQFINYEKEIPEHLWTFQFRPLYFDLWSISRFQLEAAGVLPHHIEIAGLCTRSDDRFYSYRRDKVTGRHGTILALC